ncbi:vesicle transport protein SEC22 [Acrasis kona]
MLKLTLIARLSDCLPLTESMEPTSDAEIEQYKKQRKNILQQLSSNPVPPEKLSVDSGNYAFHVVTESGVAFMTLCEKAYSTQLAYGFLADIKGEFLNLYGSEVAKVDRPYAFIKFDSFIQKTIRVYSDTRTKRNIQKLKEE